MFGAEKTANVKILVRTIECGTVEGGQSDGNGVMEFVKLLIFLLC